MRGTRERKPVDYSSTGLNAGTGTPSWLKVSAKPSVSIENKAPLPFMIMEDVKEKKAGGRKSMGGKSDSEKASNDKEKKRKSAPSSSGPLGDRSNAAEEPPRLKKAKTAAPVPAPIEVTAPKQAPTANASKPAPAPAPIEIIAPKQASKAPKQAPMANASKPAPAPAPIEIIAPKQGSKAPKQAPKANASKPAPAIVQEVIIIPPPKAVEAIKNRPGRPASLVAAAAAAATAKQSAQDEETQNPPAPAQEVKSKSKAGNSKETKKMEAAPAPPPPESSISQLLDLSAAAANPKSFVALQEQYVHLQNLYQQLKAQKIQDLEGLLEEQDEYVETLNSSVQKLADHWKKEAEKQAEIGRLAGSSEFVAKAQRLAAENSDLQHFNAKLQEDIVRLRKDVLEREARMVAAQAQAAELRSKLEAHIAAAQAAAAQFEAEKLRLVALRGGPNAVALALAQMTPAPLAGHHNNWMQCPTPPVPSPGIGMQFPSPLMASADAQVNQERVGSPVEGILSLQDERRMDDGVSSEPLAPPPGPVLSAGMIQLMASAQMTAKKLSMGMKSRSMSDARSEPPPVPPPAAMEEENSNQGSSNRIPEVQTAPPQAPQPPPLSPEASPGLSLASMTPGKTALLGGVVDFFGFKVLPLRVPGAFEYIHPKTGLRFQMGPIEVEDSELAAEEHADGLPDLTLEGEGLEEHSSVHVLLYRPLNLGKAKLPAHLCDELMVPLFSKDAFVNQLWRSVNG